MSRLQEAYDASYSNFYSAIRVVDNKKAKRKSIMLSGKHLATGQNNLEQHNHHESEVLIIEPKKAIIERRRQSRRASRSVNLAATADQALKSINNTNPKILPSKKLLLNLSRQGDSDSPDEPPGEPRK